MMITQMASTSYIDSTLRRRSRILSMLRIHTKVLRQLGLQLLALNVPHMLRPLHRVYSIIVRTGEDDIQLLEATALGLGEEEVDAGNDSGVKDSEHDVGAVAEVGEGWRGDHDDLGEVSEARVGTGH